MADTLSSRAPRWSHLVLAGVLVALVGGAFWLKSRPKAALSGAARAESTESLLARGIQAHNAGSLDAAMDLYFKVLQREPAHPQAHYNIAQIYNARGQNAKAQWEYEAALKAEPQSVNARLNLGVVLYRQRQFAAAAQEFRKVLEASPKNALARFNLGITVLELGQTDEAIRWLTAALQDDPKGVDAHYYLGLAFERKRRFPEARVEFLKVLELNPRYPVAYVALARVYSAQGEQRLAQEASAKAAELDLA